ncbi:YbjN domain-containing protein [Streptomyces sp. NPDC006971]|uniref:YbjN domain-containing protein n=1 Tax=Streptomyces sp. NPDC006971 TaxID=3154784 RepID=UPI0033DD815A
MSIDPSSIPNFGGQPEPQAAGPEGPVVPDQDLVKQLLDQMELKYVVDDEGDLAAPWEEFRTYFMFRGEAEQQVFSVRTFYDRPHAADQRPVLLDAIDDWNRRTLWPKVYTHTHEAEEGSDDTGASIRLIGEAQMLIGTGVSLEHFVSSTVSWVRASIEFDKWLQERLGLVPSEEKPEGADGTEQAAPGA